MNHRKIALSSAQSFGRSTTKDCPDPDMNRALVVAASPINRIVIARTVERIYLKPDAATPEAALDALRRSPPMVVIIDRPAEDDLLDPLLSELAQRRRACEKRLPRVVLIAGPSQNGEKPLSACVDAVVLRPITPDVLQPIIERLMAGGGST